MNRRGTKLPSNYTDAHCARRPPLPRKRDCKIVKPVRRHTDATRGADVWSHATAAAIMVAVATDRARPCFGCSLRCMCRPRWQVTRRELVQAGDALSALDLDLLQLWLEGWKRCRRQRYAFYERLFQVYLTRSWQRPRTLYTLRLSLTGTLHTRAHTRKEATPAPSRAYSYNGLVAAPLY